MYTTDKERDAETNKEAYERGKQDAANGIPPREGVVAYLTGYAENPDQTILRQPRTA